MRHAGASVLLCAFSAFFASSATLVAQDGADAERTYPATAELTNYRYGSSTTWRCPDGKPGVFRATQSTLRYEIERSDGVDRGSGTVNPDGTFLIKPRNSTRELEMKGVLSGDALTAQYTVKMGGRIRATCIYTFSATRQP